MLQFSVNHHQTQSHICTAVTVKHKWPSIAKYTPVITCTFGCKVKYWGQCLHIICVRNPINDADEWNAVTSCQQRCFSHGTRCSARMIPLSFAPHSCFCLARRAEYALLHAFFCGTFRLLLPTAVLVNVLIIWCKWWMDFTMHCNLPLWLITHGWSWTNNRCFLWETACLVSSSTRMLLKGRDDRSSWQSQLSDPAP